MDGDQIFQNFADPNSGARCKVFLCLCLKSYLGLQSLSVPGILEIKIRFAFDAITVPLAIEIAMKVLYM